ncbi:MAG: nitrile hydratase accessory protein [Acidimicrobiales bacterium]
MTGLLPGQPERGGEPVFAAPWEAQAFAMVVRLHEQGLFTWAEWAAALAREIADARRAGEPDTGATYYHHWLTALERLVAATGAASADEQSRARAAWRQAAARTPHGHPIELRTQDVPGRS